MGIRHLPFPLSLDELTAGPEAEEMSPLAERIAAPALPGDRKAAGRAA
jgi:hypothetical protein